MYTFKDFKCEFCGTELQINNYDVTVICPECLYKYKYSQVNVEEKVNWCKSIIYQKRKPPNEDDY